MNNEYLRNAGINVDEVLNFWGDMEAYSDNLIEFLNGIDKKLDELESYKNNGEISSYTILAHSLKSETRYLGLNKLSDLFYNHELKGKEGNIDYIKNNFIELINAVGTLKNDLKDYLHSTTLKKTLLVVDDSNIIINYIENLVKNDYNVVRANNGIEAVNKVNENIYAILLDINMPKSNGIDVLKYLTDNDLIEKIPVVIITGNDTKEAIREVIGYNVLDVLNKPFTPDNIKKVISLIENFHNS
ncbi:MAG: response regulator [Tenericutes bacterium]|nr:response regulator [Mycoplasmatota bacterium]